MLTCIASIVVGQTTFIYNYAANPEKASSQTTIKTTVTVTPDLMTVKIKEGANLVNYKVVRLNTAPKGEFNLTFENNERLFFNDGFAILYNATGVAKRFWTNNRVTIK